MMDREAIRHSILTYLQDDLGEELPDFNDDLEIREGLGLDSVDVVGLVMQVERQLRIRLDSESLTQIQTVGNLLDLLEKTLAETATATAEPVKGAA